MDDEALMRILNRQPAGSRSLQPAPNDATRVTGPLAMAAVGAAILAILGNGVDATLSALTQGDRSPEITSGTLLLTLDDVGVGFSTDVTDLAPGDLVERFVDVINTGTLATGDLTMEISATGAGALISDGTTPSTTKALTLAIDACSVPWAVSPSASTCAGTVSSPITVAPLGSVIDTVNTIASSLASGDVIHLRVRIGLPDQDETSINGILPVSTVQGRSVTVTATFLTDQREAITTRS
jgi:hypothetical protein